MTTLASKATRDSIGINTYERGMLYAVLLLMVSNTSAANSYYEAIKMSFERGKIGTESEKGSAESDGREVDPKIIIEAHLPYNDVASLKAGGNYFEYIESFNNADPNPLRISLEPDPNPFHTIANEPAWVDTLEKYLMWVTMHLELSTYYYDESFALVAKSSLVTNSNKKTFIKIDAKLPYDYSTFIKKRNLLAALRTFYLE